MTDRAKMNGKPVFTVPAKTVINFKSGFGKKLLCDDLTFTTGTACAFKCSFCFVPSQMRKQRDWLHEHGVTGEHEDIVIRRENPIEIARKQLKNAKDKDKPLVIYASPLVDVARKRAGKFQAVLLISIVSRMMIRPLRRYGYEIHAA